jgi:precorrin-4 methylase
LISGVIIETIREELKKQSEAEETPVTVEIKYSDTDQTIRREALKLLKEWGYDEPPEDIKK